MRRLLEAWRFRQHVAVVSIEDDTAHFLEMKKAWGRLQVVAVLQEKLPAGSSSSDIVRLLATALPLSHKRIVLKLPEQALRHQFLHLDPDLDTGEWIAKSWSTLLPPGLKKGQVALSCQRFRNAGGQDALLLTLARSDLIAAWLDAFATQGLELTELSGSPQAFMDAYAFAAPDFYGKAILAFSFGPKRTLVFVAKKGSICAFREIPTPQTETEKQALLLAESASCEADGGIDEVLIVGKYEAAPPPKLGYPLRMGSEISADILATAVASDQTQLIGLGLQSLYPEFENEGLLPEAVRKRAYDKLQQLRLFHSGLITLLSLAALLLCLHLLSIWATTRLQQANREMLIYEERIAAIDSLEALRGDLAGELLLKQKIINQNSKLARLLSDVGRVVPKDVWLRQVTYEHQGETEDDAPVTSGASVGQAIQLEGLALSELGPTLFLAELEKLPGLRQAQLDAVQTISAENVLKQTKLYKIPLYKFKVSAWISASG